MKYTNQASICHCTYISVRIVHIRLNVPTQIADVTTGHWTDTYVTENWLCTIALVAYLIGHVFALDAQQWSHDDIFPGSTQDSGHWPVRSYWHPGSVPIKSILNANSLLLDNEGCNAKARAQSSKVSIPNIYEVSTSLFLMTLTSPSWIWSLAFAVKSEEMFHLSDPSYYVPDSRF